jgi:aminoglycoside phosphotransferase (APT) family kinase protein
MLSNLSPVTSQLSPIPNATGFMIDETQPVRKGEELDTERLREFLSSHLATHHDDLVIEQFPAGSSNLTYLVRLGDEVYVLRRPPFGNTVKTAHDMRREFDVLSKLSKVYVPAPKPLLFCDNKSVIGSEFYLMERRQGLIIRGIVNSSAVSLDQISNDQVAKARASARAIRDLETSDEFRIDVCKSFIQNLADLHNLDYKAAGLADLGKPVGYNRRQVEGWAKRYFAAKTHDLPDIEKTIRWLNDNIPAESGAALIHNDYKFDNIMLDPDDLTSITAVLDWEMVTIGDPLMDLGTSLGYWMSADAGDELLNMPFNPRVLMENISRHDLAKMYADATGRDISNILFYYVFGTFKIAVIAQQIYTRYAKGFTKDQRFAKFDTFVAALGSIAAKAINNNSI